MCCAITNVLQHNLLTTAAPLLALTLFSNGQVASTDQPINTSGLPLAAFGPHARAHARGAGKPKAPHRRRFAHVYVHLSVRMSVRTRKFIFSRDVTTQARPRRWKAQGTSQPMQAWCDGSLSNPACMQHESFSTTRHP